MPQAAAQVITPPEAPPTRRRTPPINKPRLVPCPAVAHRDADVLRLAKDIQANDEREADARVELPDPDTYTPLSPLCDPATLAMDHAYRHGRHLRNELAALVAETIEGLQVKAAVVASDAGYDPARPDAIVWTEFEVCDALGMSIMRDLLLMKAEPSELR